MGHKSVFGATESGKSILVRSMVNTAIRSGDIVGVVYDPTLSPEWNTPYVTHDERQFFAWVAENYKLGKSMVVVVDEADTFFSMGQRHNWWLATRGRHFGIELIIITQRPTLVAPSVRGQCNADIYCFRLGLSDAKALAEDTSAPDLMNASGLLQGQFLRAYWKDKKKVVDTLRIF